MIEEDCSVAFHIVEPQAVLPLRAEVLRHGLPLSDAVFDGDDKESTVHAGCYRNGKLVACASVFEVSNSVFGQGKQYQLRGMAVDQAFRNCGIGRALLQYVEFLCLNRHAAILWCNARVGAKGFYEKNGYTFVGQPFEIDGVGTHLLAFKELKYHTCKHQ